MSRVSYLVIFEGDHAESNVAAFVPALDVSIMGDTYEETRTLVKEILNQEIASLITRGQGIPSESARSETIELAGESYPVLYESSSSVERCTAYIPGLRVRIAGMSLLDVRSKARTILESELAERTTAGRPMPNDFVRIESVSVNLRHASHILFRQKSFRNAEVLYNI
ncbi:type II toxin-antitoxin system HicB family antitoxin [Paenibacillus rubinfantis]|uniref:type II toxin-antitoxin system HicB family antitoxin n=1 Tax=Paenibacillus rubinfantis TaxID=1720296 RepID=UPI00073F8861|nr:hypothetical protein [Paenibacillus rubinfantis]